MKKIVFLLFALFFTSSAFAQSFIALADIHFNPFAACVGQKKPCALLQQLRSADIQNWDALLQKYDQASPQFKNDTNFQLLKTTELELATIQNQIYSQFVIVLGDFLAHDFRALYLRYNNRSSKGYAEFVYKTMDYLAQELHKTFPGKEIFCLVGNNDSDYNDYYVTSSFFKGLTPVWSRLLSKNNQYRFRQEFPNHGYYSATLPGVENFKLIVLNTVLFSKNARGKDIQQQAENQLHWLDAQLKIAEQKKQKILLVGHVPMGIDIFMTLRLYRFTIISFWRQEYTDAFRDLLQKYPETVTGILMAHIHMDGFELISANKNLSIPVVQVPSVSPIFGNNPSFKVMSYNPTTFQLNNFVTYFYNMSTKKEPSWKEEYSFNDIYQPNCKYCNIVQGMSRLSENNLLSVYYRKYYTVSGDTQPIDKGYWSPYYWCGMHTFTPDDYKECVRA